MIIELHNCLNQALKEPSVPVLTQTLKCLAALIQATPYHKLPPGLISKLIKAVKILIYHKDTSVQVTSLVVLGCALASEPALTETTNAFLGNGDDNLEKTELVESKPNYTDSDVGLKNYEVLKQEAIPWLLKRCLANLRNGEEINSPTPVKIESLQILSAMSQNYFQDLLAPYMSLVTMALNDALDDKYTDVRLHAGRAVEFIGTSSIIAIKKFRTYLTYVIFESTLFCL